jgi:AraC-like DNA-binding protein
MALKHTRHPVFFNQTQLGGRWLHFFAWHKFQRFNVIPKHTVEAWEIMLQEVGHFDLLLDNEPVHLPARHMLVIPPGVTIASQSGANVGLVYYLAIGEPVHTRKFVPPVEYPATWRELQDTLQQQRLRVLTMPEPLLQAARQTATLFSQHAPETLPVLQRASLGLGLTAHMLSALQQPQLTRVPQATLVEPALRVIRADPTGEFRIPDLARRCGMSQSTLHREFKRATGMTPHHYINQQRLTVATALLAQRPRSTPLAQIAAECGFQSGAYFAVVFRRLLGVTPHTYRMQLPAHSKVRK